MWDIQSQPKNLDVGLADVDEARRYKGIDEPVQLKLPDAVHIEFARLVAYHDYLQPVAAFELRD